MNKIINQTINYLKNDIENNLPFIIDSYSIQQLKNIKLINKKRSELKKMIKESLEPLLENIYYKNSFKKVGKKNLSSFMLHYSYCVSAIKFIIFVFKNKNIYDIKKNETINILKTLVDIILKITEIKWPIEKMYQYEYKHIQEVKTRYLTIKTFLNI